MGYIAGIGGANVDIHARSDRPLIMRDSNPGMLYTSLGGVCRNICENLALLKTDIRLATVVGDDDRGRNILSGCEKVGIDMRATRVIAGERSSGYVSVMDEQGDMLLAMSDMHIIKRMDADFVDANVKLLCEADMVICDGNLSVQTIERLTEVCLSPLYLDPVSTSWAKELKPFIASFDTIKPNVLELEALSGCPCTTLEEIEHACGVLIEQGVRRVFVSMGAQGMLYKGHEGTIYKKSRPFERMVNATGAGDAAMAGIVYASREGKTAEEILCFAMGAGMVAISGENTINPEMSVEAIEKMIKEYIV